MSEEELKCQKIELEEINEDIEDINKKILRYTKKLEAFNEDDVTRIHLKVKVICLFKKLK